MVATTRGGVASGGYRPGILLNIRKYTTEKYLAHHINSATTEKLCTKDYKPLVTQQTSIQRVLYDRNCSTNIHLSVLTYSPQHSFYKACRHVYNTCTHNTHNTHVDTNAGLCVHTYKFQYLVSKNCGLALKAQGEQ